MITAEQLLEVFDHEGLDGRWSAFSRAIVDAVRAVGPVSSEAGRLIDQASALWEQHADAEAITSHRVAVWQYLDAKNGNSTTIRDADDHALRALIAGLWPEENRAEAQDSADWVEEMLGYFAPPHHPGGTR